MRTHSNRARLLATTAGLAALSVCGHAFAQTGAQAAAPNTVAQPPGQAEVVVTAQKREQALTQVPVAITAFTSVKRDQIGIDSVQDMSNFTPGFTYNAEQDRVSIRGISRVSNQLGLDSSLGTYEDGAFETFIVKAGNDDIFVDRIEVLRGPQGTLYGRNSIGGAVNIISRRPTKNWYGEVRASYNNYNEHIEEGAFSGPVTDNVQFRISGSKTDQTDGYFKNLAPGGHSEGQVRDEYYVEAQLQGQWGEKFDWWAKGFTGGWDNLGGNAGGRSSNVVIVGPDGKSALPASQAFYFLGANTTDIALGPLGGPSAAQTTDIIGPSVGLFVLPGTTNIVTANPTLTNPGNSNIRDIYELDRQTVKLHNYKGLEIQLNYHADKFDVKYTGAAQGYAYETHEEYPENLQLGTGVVSYTSGALGGLTIYPTDELYYGEYHWLTSNELDFVSSGDGPLQWVAGLYNYNEGYNQPEEGVFPGQPELAQPLTLTGGLAPPNPTRAVGYSNFVGGGETYATFGQIDYKIMPTLKMTLGLRYSYDEKYGDDSSRFVSLGPLLGIPVPAAFDVFPALIPGAAIEAATGVSGGDDPRGQRGLVTFDPNTGFYHRHLRASWNGLSGTAGLQWDPDRDTNLYAKYSRGYKSGGFNGGLSFVANPETNPEFVNDYQIGFKKNFGRTITLAIDGFYDQYYDAQEPVAISTATGTSNQILNLPEARTAGVEIETSWTPIRALQVIFNYGYDNTDIIESGCIVDTLGDPNATRAGATPGNCPVLATGVRGQDLKGGNLPNAPENKVALNGNYTFFFEPGNLTFSASYIWRDSEYGSIFSRPYNESPSWDQIDLRASFYSADKHWTLIAYGKNVTNTTGYSNGATSVLQGNGTYLKNYFLTPPAIGGVELQYRFERTVFSAALPGGTERRSDPPLFFCRSSAGRSPISSSGWKACGRLPCPT